MADILPTLLAFPPEKKVTSKEYDKQAQEFIKSLHKFADSTWTKTVNKQNILDLINPEVNTLTYLVALDTQCHAAGKDRTRNEEAVNRAIIFFTSFDPVQARYAGEHWIRLISWVFDIYPQLRITDYQPIVTAMLRLDPTAGTFTSSHLRLLRGCLEAGVPSQALPILDKNIYSFPQQPPKNLPDELLCEQQDLSNSYITAKSSSSTSGFSIPLKSEFVLEYYLLGAHIYIGLRNFSRARLFLEYIILTPTVQHACSALQVEAYKKWSLIGLLEQGECYKLPRTHDQQVLKSMRAASKAYDTLVDTFEKRDWRKFQAEMDTGVQLWHDDGNTRLVQEAGNALLRFRVVDLQKTYATLPVSRVATDLGLPADGTLQLLRTMIEEGHLNATITPSGAGEPILSFTTVDVSSTDSDDDVQAQTKRIEDLVVFVRDADRRLQLTKEYVEFVKRNKRGAAGPDGDLADQMDLTWDAPIPGLEEGDEDIMGS